MNIIELVTPSIQQNAETDIKCTNRSIADCSENVQLCQSTKRIHMSQSSTKRLMENITYSSTATSTTSQVH